MSEEQPIDLPISAWSAGTGATVDPTVAVQIPAHRVWRASVALNPVSTSSSQQAMLVITLESGQTMIIGVRAGITPPLRTSERITSVMLDTGASGGALRVWIDDLC